MVSEKICLDILKSLHGNVVTCTSTWHNNGQDNIREQKITDALSDASIYRPLLKYFQLHDIDAALRWLQYGGYLGETRPFGLTGPSLHTLSEKGRLVCENGSFDKSEQELFYHEHPYLVFVAHQFNADDEMIYTYLQNQVLKPNGFDTLTGKADSLEDFRKLILAKIQQSRFFICLLTKRDQLQTGQFVSSVWLYQEIGAAMAFGKKPLVLVEDVIASHYAGELQKIYEYVVFSRTDYSKQFAGIIPRFYNDLSENNIPLPKVS